MSESLYNGIVLPETWPPRDVDGESTDPLKAKAGCIRRLMVFTGLTRL